MSDVLLTVIIGPVVVLLATFVVNEVVKPLVTRRLDPGKAPAQAPVVGVPVTDPAAGWQAAYDAVVAQLADEAQDHQRTIRDHQGCHDLMREHGLTPIDHD